MLFANEQQRIRDPSHMSGDEPLAQTEPLSALRHKGSKAYGTEVETIFKVYRKKASKHKAG